MKKILIGLILLLSFGSLQAQWTAYKGSSGFSLYSDVYNSSTYLNQSAGKITGGIMYAINGTGDTSKYGAVKISQNGLYEYVTNKTTYLGKTSGNILAKNVYIMNLNDILSAAIDTTSTISTKINVINQINTAYTNINTSGYLNNLAYLDASTNYFQKHIAIGVTSNGQGDFMVGSDSILFVNIAKNQNYSNWLQGIDTSSVRWRNSVLGNWMNAIINRYGVETWRIDTTGIVTINPDSLTGSQGFSALTITQIWNTSGTPTAFLMNITNTSSNSNSNLMDLQVGGVSRFRIKNNGDSFFGNDIFAGQSRYLILPSNSSGTLGAALNSSVDGVLTLNNAGIAGTIRVNFGGNTSSFPSWKRSGTKLYARLADDSGYTGIVGGDHISDDATKGLVLKDTQATPHYWRITISNAGVLVITDLGTTMP